jgi:NADH-quinone oxidoreductase subunit J
MLQAVLFYLFALGAVVAGLSVVTRSNPIASAVSLVACFFCLASIYAILDAHFVAIMQVLVYAGAIMVLFIFVIMLLNLRTQGEPELTDLAPRALFGLSAAGLVGMGMVVAVEGLSMVGFEAVEADYGTIEQVGRAMFGGAYLFPFEVASALLTVAMVGAVVLAKREV